LNNNKEISLPSQVSVTLLNIFLENKDNLFQMLMQLN